MKRPEKSQERDTHGTFFRMHGSSQFIISVSFLISVHSHSPSRQNPLQDLKPNSFQSGGRVDAWSPPWMRGDRLPKIQAPHNFFSVLYPANVCIMLQECSDFATQPDGERWYNTQINQNYIYWEHKANINLERIFTDIKSGCTLFKYYYNIPFYNKMLL